MISLINIVGLFFFCRKDEFLDSRIALIVICFIEVIRALL